MGYIRLSSSVRAKREKACMLRLDSGALAIIPYSRMGEEKKEGYGRHPIIYIFIYISKALYVYIPSSSVASSE